MSLKRDIPLPHKPQAVTELWQMQPWLHVCDLWKSKKKKQQWGKKIECSNWGNANAAVKTRRVASTNVQESFELTSADNSASRTVSPQQISKVFQQSEHRAGARQAQSQHGTVTLSLRGEHVAGLESFHGKIEKQYSILTENGKSSCTSLMLAGYFSFFQHACAQVLQLALAQLVVVPTGCRDLEARADRAPQGRVSQGEVFSLVVFVLAPPRCSFL